LIAPEEVALRLAAAVVFGAAIGFERESRQQLAGLRTHALVAAGAAMFTLAGAYGFSDLDRGPNADPMRVAAQVASGIGFIGAGAIIRERGGVRGITTAAALWTSAAVGVAAGAGLWWVSGLGALAALVVLVGLRGASGRVANLHTPLHTIDVEYERGYGTLGPLLGAVRDCGGQLEDLVIDDEESGLRRITVDVRVGQPEDLDEIAERIATRPEVRHAAVRRAGAEN
jgi:putative Mg2+ transporter-C (MgtC) family protein